MNQIGTRLHAWLGPIVWEARADNVWEFRAETLEAKMVDSEDDIMQFLDPDECKKCEASSLDRPPSLRLLHCIWERRAYEMMLFELHRRTWHLHHGQDYQPDLV